MAVDERSVLLVEDNPDDEELTLLSLREAGIDNEIHVARDGAEALEYVLGSAETAPRCSPALVLLDLKLPKVDGFSVLRQLRAAPQTAITPIVVLTSSDVDEDVTLSYRLGVNSYIRKPVEFTDFAAAVRQLGQYWLLRNESPDRNT